MAYLLCHRSFFSCKSTNTLNGIHYVMLCESTTTTTTEDSTNGFFEAVFFLEDPVFWEVCHLGLFEVNKHTYVIHGSTGYPFVCSRSKRVDRCAVF